MTKEKEETVIEVKPAKEISASSLQNPADDTATSVSLYPNVVSDEVIAAERVPEIEERMEVKEILRR